MQGMQDAAKASSQRLMRYMCENMIAIVDAIHNADAINGMENYSKSEQAIPVTDDELTSKAVDEMVYTVVNVDVTKLRDDSDNPQIVISHLFIMHYLDNLINCITELEKCQNAYK